MMKDPNALLAVHRLDATDSLSVTDQGSMISDQEVDDILQEFGHDPREAIRALLADLDSLARDHGQSVSFGFVRGQVWEGPFKRNTR